MKKYFCENVIVDVICNGCKKIIKTEKRNYTLKEFRGMIHKKDYCEDCK